MNKQSEKNITLSNRRFLLCVVLTLVLLCSCAQTPNQSGRMVAHTPILPVPTIMDEPKDPSLASELTFKDVLAESNMRHISIIKPDEDRLLELTEGRVPDFPKIYDFFNNSNMAGNISSEDAIADTEAFFDLLRSCYGGYTYFGGDAVFELAKQSIIDRLNNSATVTNNIFEQMLIESLSEVVKDAHFYINGNTLLSDIRCYYTDDCLFFKDGSEYVNKDTGKLAKKIEGYDMDEVFKLHLSGEGEFYFSPIVYTDGESLSEIEITYEDGSTELYRMRQYMESYESPKVSLDRSSCYPVVKTTLMGFDASKAGEDARKFLSYAEELRDEPVVIVDLRGNIGGNGVLPKKWLHKLTGSVVPQNYIGLRAIPYSFYENRNDDVNSNYYLAPEDYEVYLRMEAYEDNYTIFENDSDDFVEREQILIILTDNSTASSGESFVDLCFNLENTLIIGSNTAGALSFDLTFSKLKLPRTGIPFGFGSTLFLYPEGYLTENAGIQPDIWVTGDALKATIAMLKRAGI